MKETILVGVDGSATAWKAACCARDLAAALDATLHVVCAFDSDRVEMHGSGSDMLTISDAAARTGREGQRGHGHRLHGAEHEHRAQERLHQARHGRQTDCFERRENRWELIHQHASVPAGGEWDGKITSV